ncbi:MAG TPA: hypothetical protein VMW63_08860 [Methanoregulaceae archaeon]|nr:hypothetical protein [Methanoregulaceae archaeon]
MTSKSLPLIALLLALIALAVACGAWCLSSDHTAVAWGPEFHQVIEIHEDRIVFSHMPRSDTPGTYVVDYEILRNGTTVKVGTDVVYENIAETAPIVFEVPRSPDNSVSLEIEVRDTDGHLLDRSTTVINPQNTLPVGA